MAAGASHLFPEPLFPLQSFLPPLDLRLVQVIIFLLFLVLYSQPVRVEPVV